MDCARSFARSTELSSPCDYLNAFSPLELAWFFKGNRRQFLFVFGRVNGGHSEMPVFFLRPETARIVRRSPTKVARRRFFVECDWRSR